MRPDMHRSTALMCCTALAAVFTTTACDSNSGPGPAASVSIVAGASGLGTGAYDPNPFTRSFNAGNRVEWANNDAVVHRLVAATPIMDSGDLAPGATFQFTFSARGTYTYHCSIHPTMVGTITLN
jgi:plastocyanin